jgi:hypothetical protein
MASYFPRPSSPTEKRPGSMDSDRSEPAHPPLTRQVSGTSSRWGSR